MILTAMAAASATEAFAYRFRTAYPTYGPRFRTPSFRTRPLSLSPRIRQPRIYTYRAPRMTGGYRMPRDPFLKPFRPPRLDRLSDDYDFKGGVKARRTRAYRAPKLRAPTLGRSDFVMSDPSPRITLEPLHLMSQEPFARSTFRGSRGLRPPRLARAPKPPEPKCRNSKGHWINCSNLDRYP